MHKEKEQITDLSISRTNSITELKFQQLRHENDAWKRLLNFMVEENVHLKHRLADILKYISDPLFLEQAENFQSRFVKKDMLISLLRDDVADIERSLLKKEMNDNKVNAEVRSRLKKLRNNIAQTERQFSKLKLDFNCYMSDRL